MTMLIVTLRDGEERTFQGDGHLTVMEVIRNNGVDELMALCGGCCSCATCHVYVDPAVSAALPPPNGDEDDLLDSSDHRRAGSRLSCQLRLDTAPEVLRVTIAPED